MIGFVFTALFGCWHSWEDEGAVFTREYSLLGGELRAWLPMQRQRCSKCGATRNIWVL